MCTPSGILAISDFCRHFALPPSAGSFAQTQAHSVESCASDGLELGPSVNSGNGSLHLNERGSPLAAPAMMRSKVMHSIWRTARPPKIFCYAFAVHPLLRRPSRGRLRYLAMALWT